MVDFRLPLNSRVRLRDRVDPALYRGFSRTGNEGWIRNRRQDNLGYAQVLIEWDRDHWAYNGAPNGWTWEDHFDVVEKGHMSEQPQEQPNREDAIRGLTEQFLKGLFAALGASPEEIAQADSEAGGEQVTEVEQIGSIDEAVAAVKAAKAFIVVTMLQDTEKKGIVYPSIYQQAESEELALICQAQLAHLVALLQDSLIHDKLQDKGE